MKNSFYYLSILLLIPIFLFSQKEKIVKIIDSNLFETDTGKQIKLANIYIPSIYDSDTLMQLVAKRAIFFSEKRLLDKYFFMEYITVADEKNKTIRVHLLEKYPLENLNINKIYLEKGLGKYEPSYDSTYSEEYIKAENKAKNKNLGIWNPMSLIKTKITTITSFFYGLGSNNNAEFREIGFSWSNITQNGGFNFKLGFMRNAESGIGNCECDLDNCYADYLVHYNKLYVELKLRHNWKGLSMEYGALGSLRGGGWCSEAPFPLPGGSPILNFEYNALHGYYFTIAFSDEFSLYYEGFPIISGVGYHLNRKYSNVWIGFVLEESKMGVAGKFNYYFYKLLLQSLYGYMPYKEALFLRVSIGFVFE